MIQELIMDNKDAVSKELEKRLRELQIKLEPPPIEHKTSSNLNKNEFKLFEISGFGLIVRQKRKEQHLSEKALADLCGVSRSTIVRIEQGSDVTLKNLLLVMKALGLELAWK
jgi:DNA-binding XRE family transcriptional regulator